MLSTTRPEHKPHGGRSPAPSLWEAPAPAHLRGLLRAGAARVLVRRVVGLARAVLGAPTDGGVLELAAAALLVLHAHRDAVEAEGLAELVLHVAPVAEVELLR